MTNQDMVRLLAGSYEDKKRLFEYLLEKAVSEVGLEDNEIPIMEAVKKELVPEKKIVSLSATVQGLGGVKA